MLTYARPEQSFLEPDRIDVDRPDSAQAVVIPFGLEATVSYGGGTAKGPEAILAASHQLELFDEEFWREPYQDYGIATLEPPVIAKDQAAAIAQIGDLVGNMLSANRFPLVLGGEHALTAGAVRPFLQRYPDLAVLQFDAHADLRDGYLGEHYSHASAMRRVLDHTGVDIISVGIRALSAEEAAFYHSHRDRIAIHFAKDMTSWSLDEIVAPLAGRPVYVTFDVDGLDGASMPATGTPVPGGLSYWQVLEILRKTAHAATLVGADVVELAPRDGLHVCDYTAAAIAYKIMSYALSRPLPT
ncbi:MAG: agmatinase [Pseudomonadota bacterium]